MKTYYACGAEYLTIGNKSEFKFVKPSGKDALPYICDSLQLGQKLYWHCKHHSHLYQIIMDPEGIRVILLRESWECNAGAPNYPNITQGELELLQRVIREKKFWKI